MSVIRETFQPAMGPYVALAEAALALYSHTAVFRSPVVSKTCGAPARSTGSHCSGHATAR